jgi:hypothetical protein
MNLRSITAGLLTTAMVIGLALPMAEAARGGGNRVQTRPADRPAQQPANRQNVNAGNRQNVNTGDRQNVNTGNINTGDINVDRNVNVDAGYGAGGAYNGGAYYHGENYYSGSAVAGAFIGGLIIGSLINSYPPSSQTVVIHEVTYYYDGTNYYQEVYDGIDVVYKVVTDPH